MPASMTARRPTRSRWSPRANSSSRRSSDGRTEPPPRRGGDHPRRARAADAPDARRAGGARGAARGRRARRAGRAVEGGGAGADDLIALLAAGLAGAGEPVPEAEIAAAEIEGGAVAAMRAGVALMAAAFGAEGAP